MLVALSCAAALTVALSKSGMVGYVLLAVEVIAIVLIRHMGFARRARAISLKRRGELRAEFGIIAKGDD